MAYKRLSQLVAERQAQLHGDSKPDTHRIQNARQHDITHLIHADDKKPEPHPKIDKSVLDEMRTKPESKPVHFDRSLLDEVRRKPAAPDHSAGMAESSRILRDRKNAPPKQAKLPAGIAKLIRANKRPGV